jgi:prepilin-type N-terminal cleavage/methylation domain-containing protein
MKWIKNDRGLSLIEILAATVLISIITLLAFDIVNASQKQSVEQTKEGQQINDAAYVLKVITKDIRKTSKVEIKPNNEYIFHLHETGQQVIYKYVNNELLRNDQLLANHIEDFEIKPIELNSYIDVSFSINSQAYKASIAYRKGTL